MKIAKSETKVGLFVIIGFIVMVVATSLVGNFKIFSRRQGFTITAVFGSISGLEQKSPVRIAGVRVGEVEEIYLKEGLAYVRMRLRPEAVIREDSEVAVSSLGLLGEKYIEISSGSLDREPVAAGDTIQGKDVVSMDRLIGQLTDIAMDIKAMTATLRSFFGPEEKDGAPIRELVDDFDSMVENVNLLINENRANLNRSIEALADFATRAEATVADNQDDIRETVQNLRDFSVTLQGEAESLSAKLAQVADDLGASLDDARGELTGVFDDARQAARRIDETAASMKGLIDRVGEGEGTIGKLLTEDEAYETFKQTMASLSTISRKIEQGEGTLGKLVNEEDLYEDLEETVDFINDYISRGEELKLYIGFRSEYLFDSEKFKPYYTLRLEPNKDKFYLLELVDDPRGKHKVTDKVTTVTVGDTTTTIVEHEDKLEDKLKFTIQYGIRWNDVALRGGLTESSGGGGLDYLFNDDRGKISFDAWDFNRRELDPHFKISASYHVYKGLFLQAGIDDFLENDLLSFFLGGGLLFQDEDLKYLFTSVNN